MKSQGANNCCSSLPGEEFTLIGFIEFVWLNPQILEFVTLFCCFEGERNTGTLLQVASSNLRRGVFTNSTSAWELKARVGANLGYTEKSSQHGNRVRHCLKNQKAKPEAEEVAQQLGALAVLPENRSWGASTHTR